jgi:hypothetical protein
MGVGCLGQGLRLGPKVRVGVVQHVDGRFALFQPIGRIRQLLAADRLQGAGGVDVQVLGPGLAGEQRRQQRLTRHVLLEKAGLAQGRAVGVPAVGPRRGDRQRLHGAQGPVLVLLAPGVELEHVDAGGTVHLHVEPPRRGAGALRQRRGADQAHRRAQGAAQVQLAAGRVVVRIEGHHSVGSRSFLPS